MAENLAGTEKCRDFPGNRKYMGGSWEIMNRNKSHIELDHTLWDYKETKFCRQRVGFGGFALPSLPCSPERSVTTETRSTASIHTAWTGEDWWSRGKPFQPCIPRCRKLPFHRLGPWSCSPGPLQPSPALPACAAHKPPAIFNHRCEACTGAACLQFQELQLTSQDESTSRTSSLTSLCTGHKPSPVSLPEVQETTHTSDFYLYIVLLPGNPPTLQHKPHQPWSSPPYRHCSCSKAELPVGNVRAAHRHLYHHPALLTAGLCW